MKKLAPETKTLLEEIEAWRISLFKRDVFAASPSVSLENVSANS